MVTLPEDANGKNLVDPTELKLEISLQDLLAPPRMSTTSSATASVVRDWVPFNETNLQTHMCILMLMKRDGTSFDVTSVLEEDIIEICVWLGHTHLVDVLCYSATESIILFWSADDMQHAICGAIKAMVLHEEAIGIRASAPSKTHVRAYMATVGGEPSRAQPPPSEGERNLICPLVTHTQVGEPHTISKQTLAI